MWSAPPGGHGQDAAVGSVEQARRFLNQQQAAFVIASGPRILTWSSRPGILALVEGIGEALRAVGPRWLQGAGLAVDRAGKAAALAVARWGLGGVYARAVTPEAATVLERYGIALFFDRWSAGPEAGRADPGAGDPVERLVEGLEDDPAEAWRRLWAALERHRRASGPGSADGTGAQDPGGRRGSTVSGG